MKREIEKESVGLPHGFCFTVGVDVDVSGLEADVRVFNGYNVVNATVTVMTMTSTIGRKLRRRQRWNRRKVETQKDRKAERPSYLRSTVVSISR